MNTSIAERLKRPSNAFIIWSARRRGTLAQENPHLHGGALSKMLGIEWKGLNEWEKKPYIEEANKIREERLVDLPGYKSLWGKKREEPKKRKSSTYSQRHISPSLIQMNAYKKREMWRLLPRQKNGRWGPKRKPLVVKVERFRLSEKWRTSSKLLKNFKPVRICYINFFLNVAPTAELCFSMFKDIQPTNQPFL